MQPSPTRHKELSWKQWARVYAPLGVMALALLAHFSPKQHEQRSAKDKDKAKRALLRRSTDEVNNENKKSAFWARVQSLFWAVRSKTLRNMLAVSAVAAALGRRLLGLDARRTFPASLVACWALIYKWRIVETPKVFFKRTYWNTHVVEKARIAQTEFAPVFWLFNRHAQTVTCFGLSALEWLWARPILFERETIPCHDAPNVQFLDWAYYKAEVSSSLPGQGKLFLRSESMNQFREAGGARGAAGSHSRSPSDMADGPADGLASSSSTSASASEADASSSHFETPIMLCIHGLGDHKDIPYLKRFARMALRNGWRVVAWSWWKFDLMDSRDLKLVVDHLHRKHPRAPIVGVAWSAGVYSLVQYLQKAGADTPMVAAVCQSGCLDFAQACADVTANENTTYPLFLLAQAHVCIRRHVKNHAGITDKDAFSRLIIEELDPMRLYDRFVTMLPEPLPDDGEGYAADGFIAREGSIEERVRAAAHYVAPVIDHMDRIKIATLILHAEDDPIVASEHVDWSKVENNRHIIVAHTHRGGHCGWYEGALPMGDTWGDKVATNFISTVLESHSQTHFIVELVRQAMSTAQFYARPAPSFPPQQQGLRRQQGGGSRENLQSASPAGGFFSPQSMARITSASDLAALGGQRRF
jgi:predicted alpha/beta-fold hydrolase